MCFKGVVSFTVLFLIKFFFFLMFKLLPGWSLKISYNPSRLILVWFLHCRAVSRQSAQSGQLSLQLHLLKSFINISGQLILSMGFKPHWHADESPIKWQVWQPSGVNEPTHPEMMGLEPWSPEEPWQEFPMLLSKPSARPGSLEKHLRGGSILRTLFPESTEMWNKRRE